MGERVGNRSPTCLPLDPVVADRGRRVEALFHVAGFEDLAGAVGVMGPDASEAVGLQPWRTDSALASRSVTRDRTDRTLSEIPSRDWT